MKTFLIAMVSSLLFVHSINWLHPSMWAHSATDMGQVLLDALPKLSDLPGGYDFKPEGKGGGFHNHSDQSSSASFFWVGKRNFSWQTEEGKSFTYHDSIRIACYANYNSAVPKGSPEEFRAHRMTWGEKGHSMKPYEGLPGGVIEEHEEVEKTGTVRIFVRLYFWKSRECHGNLYIQYGVNKIASHGMTRPSYEERVAEARAFCRPQIERLAKLIYSRLPEGTGSTKGLPPADLPSTVPDTQVTQTEPLPPETVLLAVAGGSMVMALGALIQLLGMGGLQNLSDLRGVIENLLSTSTTTVDASGPGSDLKPSEVKQEVEVIPKMQETILPDPIPSGFEYKGKVWYQPPWEKGGPYWMDKKDYDSMRSMMRQGKVWSDRWGWMDPQEGKAMESQRAEAWDKYRSNTDEDIKAITNRIKESQEKLAEIREKQAELERIEQLRERLAQLERQRELDNSFATQLSETWKNYSEGVNRDLDALPGELKKMALDTARMVRDTTGKAITELTDIDNYRAVGQAAVETAKQLILHPVDSAVQVGDAVKDAATLAKNMAAGIASDPVGFAESMVGLDNWKKVLDPNVPIGERVSRALYGAVDTALNFASGGTKAAAQSMEAGVDALKAVDQATDAAKAIKGTEAIADTARLTPRLEDSARLQAWEAGRLAGQQKADRLAEAIKSGDAGEIKQALVECQKDKHAIQALNRGDDSLKTAYNEHMKKLITDDVDKTVREKIAQRYGLNPEDVEIVKPTNPTGKVKIGSDLDYTVRVKAKPGEFVADPERPGQFIKVKAGDTYMKDVPIKDAREIYNRELYSKVTGEPIPTDPKKFGAFQARADQLAHEMDHVAGHRVGAESYGASQQDLEVVLQKSGGRFTDPNQVGMVATYKSTHLYQQAEEIAKVNPAKAEELIAEGMRQTTKQYKNLIETRLDALQSKGIEVAVDPRLTKAVEILKQVETKGMSPAEAEALLRSQLNLSKDDVANMLGGQLAKLHMIKA
ncbi:MAG: hypothetical protein N3G78_05870 [Desulfobacterota bacterium]|nr:hypothetical protein [Thermodesulfobacteriota bacterium]